MDLVKQGKEPSESEGIRLTEAAAKKLQEIMKDAEDPEKMYLFVGVKGGGCSGLQYILDLRHAEHAPPGESDEFYTSGGVPIVIDLKSYVVGNLGGTEIDYAESLMGGGFVFNNPNAKTMCGCGQSYSA
jgi:iron-sulfur cluster assembly protein